MKAIMMTEYGPPDVLQIQEVKKPSPKENELLVKVHATSVGYGDLVARNFSNLTSSEFNMPAPLWLMSKFYFGFSKPRIQILGSEFSGEIESVGSQVKKFKAGDTLFGYLGQDMGAYAEYLCIPEDGVIAIKPDNISFEDAAVLPMGSIMALYLLREKGDIQPDDKVLINGGSGGIGSAAIQIAKHHYGAEVTAVCSTPRLEFVKALGADHAIDYSVEDFTENGQTYDLIFDVLGKSSFSKTKSSLKEDGRVVYASFKTSKLFDMLKTSISGDKKVICALAPGSKEDLLAVQKLIEAGKIKAIIDRRFPLEKTAEAHQYVQDGFRKGHVVITLE